MIHIVDRSNLFAVMVAVGALACCSGTRVVGQPSCPLWPGQTFLHGGYGRAIETADFDGDGDADLLSVSGQASVAVMLNQGNATFAAPVHHAVQSQPRGLSAADLDADGDIDVVVSNFGAATVSVLMNQGGGAFAPATHIFAGDQADFIQAVDVDADGDTDVALSVRSSVSMVMLLLNDGRGTLSPGTTVTAGHQIAGMAMIDLDKNGLPDLVSAFNNAESNHGRIMVRRNLGSAQFAPPTILHEDDREYTKMATGDVDADGDLDFLISRMNGDVMLGRNHGAFPPQTTILTGVFGSSDYLMDLRDVNGDGASDLLIAYGNPLLRIWMNDGHGGFAPPTYHLAVNGAYTSAVSDFDLDGDPDLAVGSVSNPAVVVLRNRGDGTLDGMALPEPFTYALWAGVADLDGDGDDDLVLTANGLQIKLSNGDGTFNTMIDNGGAPETGVLADVDEDDDPDMVYSSPSDSRLRVRRNDGAGNFGAASEYFASDGARDMVVFDADNDGDRDVAFIPGSSSPNHLRLMRNDGTGVFGPSETIPVPNRPRSLIAVDLDLDGDDDLTAVHPNFPGPGLISVLRNTGAGGFAPFVTYPTPYDPTHMAAADLDGDGWSDLVVSSHSDSTSPLTIHRNDGTGAFPNQFDHPLVTDIGFDALLVRDFNGDGRSDVMTYNRNTYLTAVMMNQGDGSLGEPAHYAAPYSVGRAVAGDFNVDGVADLAICASPYGILLSLPTAFAIEDYPIAQASTPGGSATFTVATTGRGIITYQWRKDGVDLANDSHLSGAHTPQLMIDPVSIADAGAYDVLVSNGHCSLVSLPATLSVLTGCAADISPPQGDGEVNVRDLLAVISAWGACGNPNVCPADIAPAGGNDVVNVQDLLAVIGAWGACP